MLLSVALFGLTYSIILALRERYDGFPETWLEIYCVCVPIAVAFEFLWWLALNVF